MKPDSFTMSCVLKAMSEVVLDGPPLARMVHCYVIKHGFDSDVFLGNGLVTYYSRCDDILSARNLFDEMPVRDLVSWNSMISGYSQGGFFKECKDLYKKMLLLKDLRPNGITIVSILQACAQSSDLILGMEVHKYVVKNRIEIDLSLCNSFIALYAKCGSLDYARELFEEMSEKDEITYGTIISGYMVHGFVDEAMRLFTEMRNPGLSTWNAVISGAFQNNRYENVVNLAQQMQDSGRLLELMRGEGYKMIDEFDEPNQHVLDQAPVCFNLEIILVSRDAKKCFKKPNQHVLDQAPVLRELKRRL
ncbi:unnamed protein product [Fraxinus pennsylvanica]|uniref:Pentatricopeptide repeat-containing protein n=1 Tax=Fraxinus pennsylvanica TaxID=56036 RepID=A0AAD2E8H6_9LAMI|nr:unnamed protein product [Fraxinus pennsylvanica]